MNKITILIVLLLATASLQCGTINVGWSFMTNQDVHITDIQFMPDNDYFLLATDKGIQLRKSLTGDSIMNYSYECSAIEITNDSTRLIGIGGKGLRLFKLSDMSLIKSYNLPNDSLCYFTEIVCDPIRPYVYAIWDSSGWYLGKSYDYRKIIIYNYETMTPVGELTTDAEHSLLFQNLGISKDGKYLAVLNQDVSYLKVWSLDSMKEIRSFKLCEHYDDDYLGLPQCLKFSELNTDNIYYSGDFPQNSGDYSHQGINIYDIKSNKIIDSTFGINSSAIVGLNSFALFNNEKKIMGTNGYYLKLLDMEKKEEDTSFYIYQNPYFCNKIEYSKGNKYFIGYAILANKFSIYIYDSITTNIKDNGTITQTIYPNPTNEFININLQCNDNNQEYEIYDINSQLILTSPINIMNDILTIDFSIYQNGIYFLKLYCGNNIITYKIIKKG